MLPKDLITKGKYFSSFVAMDFIIGQVVREKLEAKDIKFRRFADHMGMTERNLQNWFKRNDITVHQLQRASEFLGEDLTVYFKPKIASAPDISESPTQYNLTNELKMCLFLKGNLTDIPRFKDMLKEMNGVSEKYGFSVMT